MKVVIQLVVNGSHLRINALKFAFNEFPSHITLIQGVFILFGWNVEWVGGKTAAIYFPPLKDAIISII